MKENKDTFNCEINEILVEYIPPNEDFWHESVGHPIHI